MIDHSLGRKQVSIWLGPDGGTIERQNCRSGERTLTDQQLGELTDLLSQIEALYGQPTDVEWAYADGRLYVLQARLITTYVPLPPEMITEPGERRRIYTDTALADGLTINAPISPMGIAWIEDLVSALVTRYVGTLDAQRVEVDGTAGMVRVLSR